MIAVKGPNGSGKSSLFEVISDNMDQSFNITMLEQISIPNGDIFIIPQDPYCPLFVKPFDWILGRNTGTMSSDEKNIAENIIVTLLQELKFYTSLDEKEFNITQELYTEQSDYYQSLSGGQVRKIEFTKLFLLPECPSIVLIDEGLGPLDHESKKIVQNKIKSFCADSIVMIIYHTDAEKDCVDSGGFFDAVVQFDNAGMVSLVGTCESD